MTPDPMENPWLTVSSRRLYDNPWITVREDRVVRPDGEPGIYGVVHYKNIAVGVLPVEEDHDYLVGQYRYPLKRYSWEVPEGGCPEGEEPLRAAQRELREETGLEAAHWRMLGEAHLSNSVADEYAVWFLATPPDLVSLLAVIIADTHIPRRARALPEGLLPHLGRADLVLHAGDLMDPALLEELAAYAPVRAVRGNLDPPDLDLPESLEFELGGVRVAMIHDSGRKQGRRARLRRRFQDARVVVFGHSHIPFLEDESGFMLLNPGSPTDRRRQPYHTFALLRAEGGEVRAEIMPLQDP